MKGINITKIAPAAKGQKGTTLEWQRPDRPATQITIYERSKDCDFGGHVHKGEDPSKNPEILMVLCGLIKLRVKDQSGNEEEFILGQYEQIEIDPGIVHWMQALTPNVTILEWRQTLFDPTYPDTEQA